MLKILENPKKLVTVFIIGYGISISIITVLITKLSMNWFNSIYSFFISLLIITVIFSLSKLISEVYAVSDPEKVAINMIQFIKIISVIFYPFILISNLINDDLLNKLSNHLKKEIQYTEEEIETMVELSGQTGILEKQESKMIRSALAFDDTPAKDVLTPRVDMVCTPIDTSVDDTLKLMINEGYSRIPVYEENIDNIVGIVNLKDLLKVKEISKDGKNSIKNYMRQVYHVPENKHINELLNEMRTHRIPMVIVSDEYGGTAGLVTMEDIIEEIVGDIKDEHDYNEQPMINKIDNNTLLVDGKVDVEEINEILQINLPDGQTVGGLVFNTLGKVPDIEEEVIVNNVLLKVKKIDGIRIQQVEIKKLEFNEDGEYNTKETIQEKTI